MKKWLLPESYIVLLQFEIFSRKNLNGLCRKAYFFSFVGIKKRYRTFSVIINCHAGQCSTRIIALDVQVDVIFYIYMGSSTETAQSRVQPFHRLLVRMFFTWHPMSFSNFKMIGEFYLSLKPCWRYFKFLNVAKFL